MSYCDYNPRLFKEFISMKTKIKPAFSETWKISAQNYSKNETCILSNSEGVSVADISIKRFFQFMSEQNLTMIGNQLQGKFIIGNDRSLYTEEMFNIWKEKFDKRVETEIDKKDLKEGFIYKTVCGSHLLYLGKRYYMTGTVKGETVKINKPGSEHFCITNYDTDTKCKWRSSIEYASRLNQRIIEEIGPGSLDLEDWEEKFIVNSQCWKTYSKNAPLYFYLDKTTAIKQDNFVFKPIPTETQTHTCMINDEEICQVGEYNNFIMGWTYDRKKDDIQYYISSPWSYDDKLIYNFPKSLRVLKDSGEQKSLSDIKYCYVKATPKV